MKLSLRTLFGLGARTPAFDLTLTRQGHDILSLNAERYAFMRDNGLLSDSFVQKVAAHMPHGGKQRWEMRGGCNNSICHETVTFDAVITTSPLGAQKQQPLVLIRSSALQYLLGDGILSDTAAGMIQNACSAFQAKGAAQSFEESIYRQHSQRSATVGITVYERSLSNARHIDMMARQLSR